MKDLYKYFNLTYVRYIIEFEKGNKLSICVQVSDAVSLLYLLTTSGLVSYFCRPKVLCLYFSFT